MSIILAACVEAVAKLLVFQVVQTPPAPQGKAVGKILRRCQSWHGLNLRLIRYPTHHQTSSFTSLLPTAFLSMPLLECPTLRRQGVTPRVITKCLLFALAQLPTGILVDPLNDPCPHTLVTHSAQILFHLFFTNTYLRRTTHQEDHTHFSGSQSG